MCVFVCVVTLQLMEKSNPVQKLDRQVVEFASGLEKVKLLLEKKSPTVSQAENVLKVFVCVQVWTCFLIHHLLISDEIT